MTGKNTPAILNPERHCLFKVKLNPYTGKPYYKAHTGRPSSYTPDIAHEICTRISKGEPLRSIIKDEHFPDMTTIMRWLNDIKYDEFRQQYTRACEDRAETHIDETIWIADTTDDPKKAQLQISTRQHYAGKLKPKKYGDNRHLNVSGEVGVYAHLTVEQIDQRRTQIAQRLAALTHDEAQDAEYTEADSPPDPGG